MTKALTATPIRKIALSAISALILAIGSFAIVASPAAAQATPGNGTSESVSGDAPGEAWSVVQDTVVEYIPTIFAFMAAFIAVVITLMLVRRGVRKVRGMIVSTGTT